MVFKPTDPRVMYAATGEGYSNADAIRGAGIFKSTNGGTQWTAITTGLPSLAVGTVLPDPFTAGTVYATGFGNNLLKSTDGGRTWAAIGVDSSPRHTIFTLAFDPSRPNVMYAGSYSALARTQDGGASWAYSGTDKAAAVAVDPVNPSIVYAGRQGDGSDDGRGGMEKSTDGGATWAAMPRGPIPPSPHDRPPNVTAFVVDPRATSTVYLATPSAGLFKSTTGGSEWTPINTGLPLPLHPTSLVMEPLSSSVLYLATSTGIFKTVDAGATWTPVNSGLRSRSIASLAVSPTEPGVIYAAASGGTQDAFLASLSADGSSLQSSTFLGGGADDVGAGVAVDERGNAYVTGWTASNSFPAIDAFQSTSGGGEDAFVAAFSGGALLYASYIGGTESDRGSAIAVDQAGNVFVAGRTASTNFPLTRPLQTTGGAFVVKIAPISSRSSGTSRMTAGAPAGAGTAPGVSAPSADVFTSGDGVRYQVQTVARRLDLPSAMTFAPDGRLFVAERIGRVRILDGMMHSLAIALTIDDVFAEGEAGLLGVALDPRFDQTRWVYLYYTARAGAAAVNRIVRYREVDGGLTERVVLLDDIPGHAFHNGGNLRFGPDDLLYVPTGDAGAPWLAQDLGSLAGKILRLNRDGTTPRANPFGSPIFSVGHRDPQGVDWDPATGELWSEEQGAAGHDEINVIAAGGNYGWPRIGGRGELPGMQPPFAIFESAATPSGGSFHHAARAGVFAGDFFVPTLQAGLLRIRVSGTPRRIVASERLVDARFGRLRSVTSGPDGLLYFLTSNGTRVSETGDRILRLVPQ